MFLNKGIGNVNIDFDFEQGDADIVVNYNNVDVLSNNIRNSGSVLFTKDSLSVDYYYITITPNNATYNITLNCLASQEELTVVRVVNNDETLLGGTTHHNYNYTYESYESIPTNDFITFSDPSFVSVTGNEGSGNIPVGGSVVKMRAKKEVGDTVDFSIGKFRYLSSDNLYTDIDTLRPLMTVLNKSFDGDTYSAIFLHTSGKKYLYLMWDYRNGTALNMNYNQTSSYDACCKNNDDA